MSGLLRRGQESLAVIPEAGCPVITTPMETSVVLPSAAQGGVGDKDSVPSQPPHYGSISSDILAIRPPPGF